MTDPGEIPSPFQPSALPAQGGSGCSKTVWIGCGLVLLLLGIGAFVFLLNAPAIATWMFTRLETVIVAQKLPADVTPEERERLRQAFASVRRGLETGKVDVTSLQPVQAKLVEIAGKQREQVTHQDVLDLAAALERLAGRTPEGSGRDPG